MGVRPGVYKHFKGGEFKVVGVAKHSETQEEFVVYEHLDDEGGLWIRPVTMFLEEVERDGYKGPRFVWVRD